MGNVQYQYYYTYFSLSTSWPFGQLCRCFVVVGVSVCSMFRCGQCFGAVFVKVNLIFKVPQGLSLAVTFNVSMWSLSFVFWDIYLTSMTKTSISPMDRLHACTSVDFKS